MEYRVPHDKGNAVVGSNTYPPGEIIDMPDGLGEEYGLVPVAPAKPAVRAHASPVKRKVVEG